MIVFTVGLPGSASTWVYNVARAALTAGGVRAVGFHGETLGDFVKARVSCETNVVVKAHQLEAGLQELVQMSGMPVLISLRDPRDAAVSLIQRFGFDMYVAATHINRSLASLFTLLELARPLTLHYEGDFFNDRASVAAVADFLKIPLAQDALDAIHERFKTESVKAFVSEMEALPSERLRRKRSQKVFDLDTQFHQDHIGDMKSGKWSAFFAPAQAQAMDAAFGAFARVMSPGETGGVGRRMAESGFEARFDSDLFAPFENVGVSRRRMVGHELIGGLGLKRLDRLYLPVGKWEITFGDQSGEAVRRLTVCQDGKVIGQNEGRDRVTFVYDNKLCAHPFDAFIETEHLESAAEAPPEAYLRARYVAGVSV